MRKTMISLMVGLALLIAYGPRVSSAADVSVSFGFAFGPYTAERTPVIYDPYRLPPGTVVYRPSPPPVVVYNPSPPPVVVYNPSPPPAVVYPPSPPVVMYGPMTTGFQFSFGHRHPRHHRHWIRGHHHRRHHR